MTEVTSLDGSAVGRSRSATLRSTTISLVAAASHPPGRRTFAALAELRERGERYDLVIVEPPAFAKRKMRWAAPSQLMRASLGWRWAPWPGGTLVTASCSSRVSAERFFAER